MSGYCITSYSGRTCLYESMEDLIGCLLEDMKDNDRYIQREKTLDVVSRTTGKTEFTVYLTESGKIILENVLSFMGADSRAPSTSLSNRVAKASTVQN
jgi:hypothetical protein